MIDFVIVGQPKSGTTALASFLSEHPEICMSVPKEPGYFATDFMKESDDFHGKQNFFKFRTTNEFEQLFKHCTAGQLRGSASTCNLYSNESAKNIKKTNPDAKIIAMFRNPVNFVHSLHMQYVNETVEDITDFEAALAAEASRKQGKDVPSHVRVPSYLFYSERIKYAEHLKRYFDEFGKNQVLVLFQEDFKQDNPGVFKQVLKHINVNDVDFQPDFKRIHASKKPRSKLINKTIHTPTLKNLLHKVLREPLYTKIHKQVNKLLLTQSERSEMREDTRQLLQRQFEPEVRKFESLLGRDLDEIWY